MGTFDGGRSMSYRDTSSGTKQSGQFNVYEYTFALDPTKEIKSITLPLDANIEVLATALIPAGTTQVNVTNQVNLSSTFNRTGIVADGTKFSGSGLDGDGYAISSKLLGTTVTAGGATFGLGPAGSSDVVSAAGQTINLPSGNDSALKLLATGVNGSQANQTFTVTYTDGTTATFTQSISDWAIPQEHFPGESKAADSTSYDRDTAIGTVVSRPAARSTSTSTHLRSTPPRRSAASPCPRTPTSRCLPRRSPPQARRRPTSRPH